MLAPEDRISASVLNIEKLYWILHRHIPEDIFFLVAAVKFLVHIYMYWIYIYI
jgi:hypothetical protein